jgi:hypothetical protein
MPMTDEEFIHGLGHQVEYYMNGTPDPDVVIRT